MDASQFADIAGSLATAATLLVLAAAVAAVVPSLREAVRASVTGLGLPGAAVVALVCTGGSLWFSEVADFPPCRLCWFQRVAMYPLVVLLGLGALRRDRGVAIYGVVLAGLGLAVSAWHIAVEMRPSLESGGCDPTNPCSIRWVEGLGFWTIPRMAAAGFALIIALLVFDRSRESGT